jgi:hypothetical protein
MRGLEMKSNWINILRAISIVMLIAVVSRPAPSRAYWGALYEPPDGKVYHGVGWGRDQQTIYDTIFAEDTHPLILQVMADLPGTRGMTVPRLTAALSDPIMHPDSQYIELGVHFKDGSHVYDSVFAFTDRLDDYIDTMAIAFNSYGRPFFLRIGYECNGPWNGYSPWIYPVAFRKLVEELRARGVYNFASVWCYEPDASEDFADSTQQGWKWYPGDDVVDWFGLDIFDNDHFDPDLPDSLGGRLTKKGRSEMFLRFANQRGKPVMLNETSARHIYITPDSLDPNREDGINDWGSWFEPYFEFIAGHPMIKSIEYIDLNWTLYDQYRDWGDARIEINTYIKDRWIEALSGGRFLHAGYDITSQTGTQRNTIDLAPDILNLSCYPNPFNGITGIFFDLRSSTPTSLKIYDITGQLIETLADDLLPAGPHFFAWKAASRSSGIYFCRLATSEHVTSRKIILLK